MIEQKVKDLSIQLSLENQKCPFKMEIDDTQNCNRLVLLVVLEVFSPVCILLSGIFFSSIVPNLRLCPLTSFVCFRR